MSTGNVDLDPLRNLPAQLTCCVHLHLQLNCTVSSRVALTDDKPPSSIGPRYDSTDGCFPGEYLCIVLVQGQHKQSSFDRKSVYSMM